MSQKKLVLHYNTIHAKIFVIIYNTNIIIWLIATN